MNTNAIPSLPWSGDEEGWSESYQRMVRGCDAIPTADPTKLYDVFERMSRAEVDFDELPRPTGIGREISVPLQKLDKCKVCLNTSNLRLCNSCASAIYCSRECQKFDWRVHKPFCSQTQQINLKTFYPFIAYMFDSLRRLTPTQERNPSSHPNPFVDSMFQKLGRRMGPSDPDSVLHPALTHRLLRAPAPGSRRATSSENKIHHTVVLGEKHNLQISDLPNPHKLSSWWKGHSTMAGMQMFLHVIRENHILEVTVAVSLLLLSEVYSAHMAKSFDSSGNPTWEPRECFRLEYGHSPVSDFGICRGRIQGKANGVQTWTYYNPKSSSRTTVLDPDNHFWLYFRTIKGEELVLDCCTFPYGMEGCVDASTCLRNLSSIFRDYGSARTPAYFYAPRHPEECPNSHSLIETERFSVMHDTTLYGALSWELFGGRDKAQHAIIHEFMTKVQGKPSTVDQEDRVRDYRSFGAMLLGQVLTGKHWKNWEKPTTHSRDDCFDPRNPKEGVFMKGSKADPDCNAKLNGLMGFSARYLV
ncbi:hypothetical protein D9756_011553 [Leucocoprinus leucothites]|uniref:MYND-type domain-containing protein n=1 Tax=Leucocoprinus leucothites TaxID=201217 RepID=A0A8H5CRB6_9AGAR|nr:hypothetical protein D9756_011553 [Leucoagaricus leucothites]